MNRPVLSRQHSVVSLASAGAISAALDGACGDAAAAMQLLLERGLDRLPLPGSGATLQRWQALVAVAQHDLSLVKLYEGHTDALAIMHELGFSLHDYPQAGFWSTWAAEAPEGRTVIETADGDAVIVNGRKCWCSGAATGGHALLTAWYGDGRGPQLIAVDLRQDGVSVDASAWQAVGMGGSASLDVVFRNVRGRLVGPVGGYLARPGFWQGGAGVAACWFGGASAIGSALRRSLDETAADKRSAFRLAAMGKVDLALRGCAAILREAAHWIDTHPLEDASAVALRTRLAAEECATHVLDETGRALGATPYCRDARFARMAADLPVFIRQSHAERDFAALGERAIDSGASPWTL